MNENKQNLMLKPLFEAVSNMNLEKIQEIISDEDIKPWEMLEDEEYTIFLKATFLDLTDSIITIIKCFKSRKDYSHNILSNWINTGNHCGHTPLMFASYRGNIQIIKLLIDNGANIFAKNDLGLDVIQMAAQGNQPNSIIYFHEKYNYNLNTKNNKGNNALHWACFTGSEDAFDFLLSKNMMNINEQDPEGNTPLHMAVISERSRIIQKLLLNGADKNILDNKNKSPLDLAIEKNKKIIIEMLEQKKLFQTNYCFFNPPIEKIERSSINIVFFLFIHFFLETFMIYYVLYPDYNIDLYNTISFYVYIVSFIILLINYFHLLLSDPGFIVKKHNLSLLQLVEKNVRITDYCPTCIIPKTFFSKHCVICAKCVDKFDHHCYWINNCIGKNNQKYFISFIFLVCFNLIINICFSYSAVFSEIQYPVIIRVFTTLVLILSVCYLLPIIYLIYFHVYRTCEDCKKNKFQEIQNEEFKQSLLENQFQN